MEFGVMNSVARVVPDSVLRLFFHPNASVYMQ